MRRGFFRLWVVVSVSWICFVGTMTWTTLRPVVEQVRFEPDAHLKSTSAFDPAEFAAYARREDIRRGAELAVIPLVFLVVLWMALGWVIRGFRTNG